MAVRRAAERFQVAATTAARWAGRYRDLGEAGMTDRSLRAPTTAPPDADAHRARIIKVRVLRRWGPARIGYLLGLTLDGAPGLPATAWPNCAGWTVPPAG